ncbi:helix-turn-helix domain-containing protein [Irregularibacter muris]|uniref:Helix-turn-helix domain-containing protein n=1 Tax=Irregularibacter muris TaxID=1796619 RepID=A0AAE3HHC7_9FIRM|nr:helix-turn-helix transcriptional regulator [Irregularibacter muris]MCR1898598.1 helix-turn-helix domain-containing protein [Irregularibacter muris]
MNHLYIGDTILRLRKEKDLTQEQLANMVGVSAGAVSKWENGNSTPDIALLSPLARALNTSLDVLLSFHRELSESEVISLKQKLREVFLHEGYVPGESKCKIYLEEYPNSVYLKLVIAGLIQMYAMMSDGTTEEDIKSRMEYSLSLLCQVVESKEPKYVSHALFSIASIQMILENYEESEKALQELSNSFIDPMVLYSSLLQKQGKAKDAQHLCKSMLLQYLNQSTAMLAILGNISKDKGDYQKADVYLDALNHVQKIFKIGMGSGAYQYCKLYIELGKKEEASKWFRKYVDGLLDAGYDYSDNPYFEDMPLEVDVQGQKIIRKRLLQSLIENPEEELIGFQEYKQAMDQLKEAVLKI